MAFYSVALVIHVVAATLFFGNIMVTGVWKVFIDKSKDIEKIRIGIRLVILTDYIFTFCGAVLLALTGAYLVYYLQLDRFGEKWLLVGTSSFILSGLIWVLFLVPNQYKQKKLIENVDQFSKIAKEFNTLAQKWYFWGTLSNIFALCALVSMIIRF
ncbi:DUF2269 family protein [Bartonella tamiae]|uniref:Integral membrane protein n=1 Tax=Bartonella tamiae Th239 TaxID=1094558 RepID=J1JVS7_9HYPH|nr:DUF2269 family protein [Bartonella tamiae]EJF88665.1 hypothetical protein ME5_01216 [Bartonella tamiae Th239]EJF95085.1 hypothetical protein MEG_00666 [Bartonella tamiae Th307]